MKKRWNPLVVTDESTKKESLLKGHITKMIWKPLIFGAVIGATIVGTYLVTNELNKRELNKKEFALEEYVKQNNMRIETILTKWTYEHSRYISLRTANEIVREVLRTNKPRLLLALMTVESAHAPFAVSPKGAIGLGQIMFRVHGQALIKAGIIKEERDLFDIAPNVKATDFVLSMCLRQNQNNISKALENYLGAQDSRYLREILVCNINLDVLVQTQ